EEIIAYRGHRRFVRSIAWSPDGRSIVSGGDFGDSSIHVWDVATGQVVSIHDGQYRNFAVSWSPDGSRIAAGNFDGTVQVWEASSGHNTLVCDRQAGPVYTIDWSPDGRSIVSGGQDALVTVWDATTGSTL
ncbi:MAG TPA: hypothetical protein DEV72_10880, partial [Ktedonobacter sp.]|nr:hypothetical protein [Ktedonobacter sp.]